MAKANIELKLSAQVDKYKQQLDKMQARNVKFANNSKKSLSRVTNSFRNIASKGIAFLKKSLFSLKGAFAAVGIGYAVKKNLDYIDNLAKTARSIGITTDQLQSLRLAANLNGVELGRLDKALKDYMRRLGGAQQEIGQAKNALELLNLTAEDIVNLPIDKQLVLIAQKLGDLDSQTKRAAASYDLFGRSGVDLLNLLADNGSAIAGASNEIKDLGISISDIDAKGVEDANDAMTRLRELVRGLGIKLASSIAPTLKIIVDKITDVAKNFLKAKENSGGLGSVITNIVLASITAVLKGMKILIISIDDAFKKGKKFANAFGIGLTDNEKQLYAVNKGIDDINKNIKDLEAKRDSKGFLNLFGKSDDKIKLINDEIFGLKTELVNLEKEKLNLSELLDSNNKGTEVVSFLETTIGTLGDLGDEIKKTNTAISEVGGSSTPVVEPETPPEEPEMTEEELALQAKLDAELAAKKLHAERTKAIEESMASTSMALHNSVTGNLIRQLEKENTVRSKNAATAIKFITKVVEYQNWENVKNARSLPALAAARAWTSSGGGVAGGIAAAITYVAVDRLVQEFISKVRLRDGGVMSGGSLVRNEKMAFGKTQVHAGEADAEAFFPLTRKNGKLGLMGETNNNDNSSVTVVNNFYDTYDKDTDAISDEVSSTVSEAIISR